MLETLRIQNYALIDAVELELRHGFNALTGETGAGKSIVVGALNLVLGGRASADVVRKGADRATIDAIFELGVPGPRLSALLARHEIPLDDSVLLISRVIGADGRSKAYAGGKLVPVSVLAELGDELVDLHGQHEHQSLLKADRQLDLLDNFAGLRAEVEALGGRVAALRALERAIAEVESDTRDRTRHLDFLRFEIGEIDAAGLAPGEDEDVKARLNRITNAERIHTLANEAYALLYERDESSALDVLSGALHALEDLAGIDPGFEPLARQLAEQREAVQALAAELRCHTDRAEFDPEELDELNRRLNLIRDLKRKYGGGIEEVLAYRERAAAEVAGHENRDERLAAMRAERADALGKAQAAAAAISKKRAAAARKLDRQVTRALDDLGMRNARFETAVAAGELTATGVDRVAFHLAANAGEDPKPLRLVASGGEVSRIMLALKSVFAAADTIPTLIFDEIDAGVGGGIAREVARYLRRLAHSHQVVCVTHLPQIAAAANIHYNVRKATHNGRTTTHVELVKEEVRVREVARLLDGTVSDLSMEHARALLEEQANPPAPRRAKATGDPGT